MNETTVMAPHSTDGGLTYVYKPTQENHLESLWNEQGWDGSHLVIDNGYNFPRIVVEALPNIESSVNNFDEILDKCRTNDIHDMLCFRIKEVTNHKTYVTLLGDVRKAIGNQLSLYSYLLMKGIDASVYIDSDFHGLLRNDWVHKLLNK